MHDMGFLALNYKSSYNADTSCYIFIDKILVSVITGKRTNVKIEEH